jgi:NAD(P)-dependent dehydrogenase (short-subunit alcohol dehydrogenase family)
LSSARHPDRDGSASKPVGGQEDLIEDVALNMAKAQAALTWQACPARSPSSPAPRAAWARRSRSVSCEEGAQVVLTDVLPEVTGTAAALGERATARIHDVADEAAWSALVDEIIARHGRIDVLVDDAGILMFKELLSTSAADLRRILEVNVVGTFNGMRAVAPHMVRQRSGSIINNPSADGLHGANSLTAYVGSKFAVRGMTKVAALELGPHGVRVNSVHPGGIDAPMANPQGLPASQLGFRVQAIRRAARRPRRGSRRMLRVPGRRRVLVLHGQRTRRRWRTHCGPLLLWPARARPRRCTASIHAAANRRSNGNRQMTRLVPRPGDVPRRPRCWRSAEPSPLRRCCPRLL